jgi:hypothetical protein
MMWMRCLWDKAQLLSFENFAAAEIREGGDIQVRGLDEGVETGKDFMLVAKVLRKEAATSRDKEGAAYQFRRHAFAGFWRRSEASRQRGYVEQLRDRLRLLMKKWTVGAYG